MKELHPGRASLVLQIHPLLQPFPQMSKCFGDVHFYRLAADVNARGDLGVGEVFQDAQSHGLAASRRQPLKVLQNGVADVIGSAFVGIERFINLGEDAEVLGVFFLHAIDIKMPDRHVADRVEEVLAQLGNLELVVSQPERFKDVLNDIFAFGLVAESLVRECVKG